MANSNVTQLAVAQQHQPVTIVAPQSFSDIKLIADAFAQSGFFKDVNSAPKAFAKILAGQELGLGPMQSCTSLHVIEGRIALDATLVGALIKKSGRYDYRVKVWSDTECVLEFSERGKAVGDSSFSMDDAIRAKLDQKLVWKQYPRDMLRSRAMTRGARTYCPDVFGGAIYDPEELGGNVEADQSGSINIVTKELELESQESPVALVQETPKQLDRTERQQLLEETLAILGLDQSVMKDKKNVAFATDTIAKTLEIPVTPQRVSEFSNSDLRRFVELSRSDTSYCDLCSTPGGEHRNDCANASELRMVSAIDQEVNRFNASEQKAA